jgi:hypothetical protein
MSNVHVFENIGYHCNTEKDIVLNKVLPNYQGFKLENIDAYVPYLIRDNNTKQYEVGIAQLKYDSDYYLVRDKIISSSLDGNAVSVKNGEFYIFANEYNFNTAFNNVIVKDDSFVVDNIRALYIVDTTKGKLSATLPCAKDNPSLIVDFKLINNTLGKLDIYCCENKLISTIKGLGKYATFASTGSEWILLQESASQSQIQKQSDFSGLDFSIQSTPGGDDGELQYRVDSNTWGGANVFYGTDSKLLFGSAVEADANAIIPTSGDVEHDTVFNQQFSNSGDFIIYGTGIDKTFQFGSDGSIGVNMPSGYSIPSSGDIVFYGNQSGNRNLFFAYDGRLGINIPTGSRPQTLAHFVNFACDETLRIENRASCHTADITLFHAPAAQIVENDTDISTITFSSKDSTQSKHTYARMYGRVLDYTNGSTSGELYFTVNSGNNLIKTFSSNYAHTKISNLSSNAVVDLNNSSIGLSSQNIVFSGDNINFVGQDGLSGTVNFANINVGDTLTASAVELPNLANGNLLTVANGNIAAASTTNTISIVGAPSGRLLSTTDAGAIETDININDLFRTNNDIIYSAYPKRLAEACLSQIIFDEDDLPNIQEYSVGDQISIEYPDGQNTLYTTVTDITVNSTDEITIMFTEDQISPSTDVGLRIQSISKGFTLTLRKYVDPELSGTNDATAIILSTRPNERTVFNDNNKPIQFTVNTDAAIPALDIRPSILLGDVVTNGTYFKYATSSDIAPLQVLVSITGTANPGAGAGTGYNTANYGYAALNRWSGLLSDVGTNGQPSSYGTYDQNGNAAEFIADNVDEHRSTENRYIAGGNIGTSGTDFNAFELIGSTEVASGVGFRVASTYGLEDLPHISGSGTGELSLEFVSITNPKNIPHNTGILVYDRSTDEYNEISISNLGKVSHFYRIGTNEVTNDQYAIFLNAVATGTDIFGLYDTQMETDDTGGIVRVGSSPYEYTVKEYHSDKPVTFVSYMGALRFSNWLHNGAPTGLTEDPANITESGAYNIQLDAGTTYSIIKSQLSQYYIPSLNEWYKSAYFKPSEEQRTNSNTVIINADDPHPSAILTVGGYTHIDGDLTTSGNISALGLNVETSDGNSIIKLAQHTDGVVSIQQLNSLALVDSENGRLTIGPNPTLQIDDPGIYNGDYRTGFAPDQVTIAADGPIKIMSPENIIMSGLKLTSLLTNELRITDPSGNIEDFIAGPSGGILYKRGSSQAQAMPRFSYVEEEDEILFTGVTGLSPLYVDNLNYIDSYENITYNSDNVEVNTLLKIKNRSDFQIGDASAALKGALLVHQGIGPLKFELNKYLEAEGLTYQRFDKRLVEVNVASKRIKFVEPIDTIGGIASGLPDLDEDLPVEYKFGDTVAIMHTGDFEVEYVKLAANLTGPFDGPDVLYIEHPPLFEEDEDDGSIFTHICPKILANEKDEGGEQAPIFTGIMYSITRCSTLTNGLGYGLFTQDPVAISGFNCETSEVLPIDSPDASFSFRPSSKNVISTRPMSHTHFNAVGENIDFAIYGRTPTLYNRYVPALHEADPNDGELPRGLVPVFRIDAHVPNAASGNATGVFNSGFVDQLNTIPTGFILDNVGKATINRDDPYIITSLNKSIDSVPSGYNTLDVVADLSVNQYTYSSGIVTDHIYLSGMHGTEYIPGATLTVDVYGKIISIAPDLPPSVPGPPLNVNGDAGNASVALRWTPPTDNGRSPIIDYIVEYSLNNGEIWTKVQDVVSDETSLVITGLVNDQRYVFRVAAVNNIGQGQYSLASAGITPTANVPSAVATLNLTRSNLTAEDDRIVVNWSQPNNSGASPITHYILKYRKTTDSSFVADRTLRLNVSDLVLTNGSYGYNLQETGYITTGPHILVQIFAVNSYGNGTITEDISLGTDPEPEPPQPPNDEYDFGEVEFSGACTT